MDFSLLYFCHKKHVGSFTMLAPSLNKSFYSVISNIFYLFSINVWCGVLKDLIFGPFVFDRRYAVYGY